MYEAIDEKIHQNQNVPAVCGKLLKQRCHEGQVCV